MGKLGSLAVGLRFGMEMGESNRNFYQELLEEDRLSEYCSTLEKLLEGSEQRKEKLQEIFRDCTRSDMDMDALEPISGMAEEGYTVEKPEYDGATDPSRLLEVVLEVEEKAASFYEDIGEASDFLSSEEMKGFSLKQDNIREKLDEIHESLD